MAPQGDDFEAAAGAGRRQYMKPHSGRHPIPTIHSYREHRKELEGQLDETEEAQQGPEDDSKPKRAYDSVKAIFKDEDPPRSQHDPYPAASRHHAGRPKRESEDEQQIPSADQGEGVSTQDHADAKKESTKGKDSDSKQKQSATEAAASAIDPKEKRKAMKKTTRHGGGREVTDPVTHLPIVIYDQTEKDLKSAPDNEPEPGMIHHTATGLSGATKTDDELEREKELSQRGHNGMQKLFPPPDFEDLRKELSHIHQKALMAGLVSTAVLVCLLVVFLTSRGGDDQPITSLRKSMGAGGTTLTLALFGGLITASIFGTTAWLGKMVAEVFEDETWDAAKREEVEMVDSETELPESVQWLNSLFASIWPLINPDLFASLVDMIEDIMQASLPKVIKMVSVDDMGQGSESVRILGIRWLPTGAASQSVAPDGQLQKPAKNSQEDLDAADREEGGAKSNEGDSAGGNGGLTEKELDDQRAIRAGMEAEDGDFVNLELAMAYRSRSSSKSIKSKAKNAHLYLKFYLPSGIAVPVWVELRGIIATLRLRLQLTPDPPFVSLCTMTFMGQPKASLSCVPLSKHSLNLMDVPLISSFVQSAIDAALAEYVAPKSLTLNLKDMLVGEDFKKDTISRGVIWIFIKKARGFKQGDGGIGPIEGTSDGYVTVSWGKFGKPVASTRIIENQQEPDWHEYTCILVTPEEVNAEEKLRLQLWDSDRWTADDDLGRVEVDLKTLMQSTETHNRIQDREDRFVGEDSEENMAGALTWSVGYFSKTRITAEQLEKQTVNTSIKTKDRLKEHVSKLSEHKLRESGKPSDDEEVLQQKAQDYKEIEDNMIISAPPPQDFVSGILSIQIHNVTGLEVQKLNKKKDKRDGGGSDGAEESERDDDMPDSYCTIILNHKKIYKTRTKPKNSKPFFNAGTERFVRDWRSSEVVVSVRDSREREDDPLIGLVYLPLAKIFSERSQVHENFPLVGGIGYGRARISLVWRSVEMKLPPNLLGWGLGTLEFRSPVRMVPAADGAVGGRALPDKLQKNRLKLRTNMGKIKMYPREAEGGNSGSVVEWKPKSKKLEDNAFLPVRRRYASPLIIEFRESVLGPDTTTAFAALWLQELADEKEQTVRLKVWNGRKDGLERARSCCDYGGVEEGEEPLGEVELTLRFWRGLSGFHKSYASQSNNMDMRNVMECLDTITDEGLDRSDEDGEKGEDENADADDEGMAEDSDSDSDAEGGIGARGEQSKESVGNGNYNDTGTGATGKKDAVPDRKTSHRRTRKKLRTHANDSSTSASSSSDEFDSKSASSRSLSLPDFKKIKNIFRSPVDGSADVALSAIAPGHNDSDDGRRGARAQLRDYKDHHKQLHRKHRGVMQWRAAREVDHLGGKLSRLKGNVSGIFKHREKDGGVETEV